MRIELDLFVNDGSVVLMIWLEKSPSEMDWLAITRTVTKTV